MNGQSRRIDRLYGGMTDQERKLNKRELDELYSYYRSQASKSGIGDITINDSKSMNS